MNRLEDHSEHESHCMFRHDTEVLVHVKSEAEDFECDSLAIRDCGVIPTYSLCRISSVTCQALYANVIHHALKISATEVILDSENTIRYYSYI